MAGGKGTRLSTISKSVPKPMVSIGGMPILERQINNLKDFGIKDIIIVVGFLGNVIKDYFKDGIDFGVNISYITEANPLGSGGSLYYLKERINDDFLLIFGDIVFSIDFNRFINFHKENKAKISLFAHPNSHPYDSDLLSVNSNNQVIRLDSKTNTRNYYYKNLVNAGLYVISSDVLTTITDLRKRDLEKDIILPLIDRKEVYAYQSSEYVRDAGTPDRYYSINQDILNGIVEKRNLKNKQKCIFLDRDGTINLYKGFVTEANQFELIPNVEEAIKLINNSEYLAIVITNQPVIARGETSFEELNNIHNKMETLLGEKGAYLNAIYFCPHHPDKGFPGEVRELKIICDCRKPKIGLLLKAQKRFNIDFSKSYFIGDSDIDVKTGNNAGCHSIKINTDSSLELISNIKAILNK